MRHQGYKLTCDSMRTHGDSWPGVYMATESRTERNAIDRARRANWFVGSIRIVSGKPRHKVRTRHLVLCPACRWFVE